MRIRNYDWNFKPIQIIKPTVDHGFIFWLVFHGLLVYIKSFWFSLVKGNEMEASTSIEDIQWLLQEILRNASEKHAYFLMPIWIIQLISLTSAVVYMSSTCAVVCLRALCRSLPPVYALITWICYSHFAFAEQQIQFLFNISHIKSIPDVRLQVIGQTEFNLLKKKVMWRKSVAIKN